jgi:hypothetical protein
MSTQLIVFKLRGLYHSAERSVNPFFPYLPTTPELIYLSALIVISQPPAGFFAFPTSLRRQPLGSASAMPPNPPLPASSDLGFAPP